METTGGAMVGFRSTGSGEIRRKYQLLTQCQSPTQNWGGGGGGQWDERMDETHLSAFHSRSRKALKKQYLFRWSGSEVERVQKYSTQVKVPLHY